MRRQVLLVQNTERRSSWIRFCSKKRIGCVVTDSDMGKSRIATSVPRARARCRLTPPSTGHQGHQGHHLSTSEMAGRQWEPFRAQTPPFGCTFQATESASWGRLPNMSSPVHFFGSRRHPKPPRAAAVCKLFNSANNFSKRKAHA